MLESPRTGFDLLKTQYLIVKVSVALRDAPDVTPPPWMNAADPFHTNVIFSGRTVYDNPSYTFTNRHGIGLRENPPDHDRFNLTYAHSWTHQKTPNFPILQSTAYHNRLHFELTALTHGHPVVCGVSGSANILGHFNRHISRESDDLNHKAAVINGLGFLTFDGGHSFNEVMAVESGLDMRSSGFSDVAHRELLQSFRLNYQTILKLLPIGESRTMVRRQLHQAIDETVTHFRDHDQDRLSAWGQYEQNQAPTRQRMVA